MTPHELITEWEALNIKPDPLTDNNDPPYIVIALGDYTYVIDPNQRATLPPGHKRAERNSVVSTLR